MEISDWYILEDCPEKAIVYPGAKTVDVELLPVAQQLLDLAKAACYIQTNNQVIDILVDYRFEFRGNYIRGHRQLSVEGVLHILRPMTESIIESKKLGFPDQALRILCGKKFGESGGLVVICGKTGHGKSMSCASIILERVKKFGSFCLTVEDPPEYPLNGSYPNTEQSNQNNGKIIQVRASKGDFSCELKDALRCYPSKTMGSMLFVGEVRDSKAAIQVLRAATTGHLVFVTCHATDIISAIDRLISLCNAEINNQTEAATLLSSCLKAVVHQTLNETKLTVSCLFSGKPDSVVANLIRGGQTRNLSSEINAQNTQLTLGSLESYVLSRL